MSKDINEIICIEFVNSVIPDKNKSDYKSIDFSNSNSFLNFWKNYGLYDIEIDLENRIYTRLDKIKCLDFWVEKLIPTNLLTVNQLEREIINKYETTSNRTIEYNLNGCNYIVYPIDLVAFEVEKLFPNYKTIDETQIIDYEFNSWIENAEKNIEYNNNTSYEVALNSYKNALKIKPENIDIQKKINWLDKYLNYKNYKYESSDTEIIKFAEIIIDCINVKDFERFYDIISDDFVFIGDYLGKSKNSFIDSVRKKTPYFFL